MPIRDSIRILLFIPLLTVAQVYMDSTWTGMPVRSVQIHGNEKTRSAYILRELKVRPGEPADPVRIEEDRKRIQNLGLFNRVMVLCSPMQDSLDLDIRVTEKWPLLFFPILHLNERSWDKISYGAGLMHSNWSGGGQSLALTLKLGYNPVLLCSYSDPWMGGWNNFAFSTDVYYQKIRSRHFTTESVTESHTGLFLGLGRRLGHHANVSFRGGFERIECPEESGLCLNASGRDALIRVGVSGSWDHRDLKEYPRSGWFMGVSAMENTVTGLSGNYGWIGTDFRTYLPLPVGLTWACRYAGFHSLNTLPVYDHVYLGYAERVRGHFDEVTEGENRLLFSSALHVPLIPIVYMDAGEEDAVRDLKFGLSLGLFADAGTTWFRNQPIQKQSWLKGFGFGLHFRLPYVDVLRLEYAFDEEGRPEWIVDLYTDI